MKTNKITNNVSQIKIWLNSVYSYNKNLIKNTPSADKLVNKLITIYFTMKSKIYNRAKDKSLLSKKIQKLSMNNIFSSKPEIKHSSSCVNITVYIYNKKANTLLASALYIVNYIQAKKTSKKDRLVKNILENKKNYKGLASTNKSIENPNTYKNLFVQARHKNIAKLKVFITKIKKFVPYYLNKKLNKPFTITIPQNTFEINKRVTTSDFSVKKIFASDLSNYIKRKPKSLKSNNLEYNSMKKSRNFSLNSYVASLLNKPYKKNESYVYSTNNTDDVSIYNKSFVRSLRNLRKINNLNLSNSSMAYRDLNRLPSKLSLKTTRIPVSLDKNYKGLALNRVKPNSCITQPTIKKVKFLFACFKGINVKPFSSGKSFVFTGKTKKKNGLINFINAKHLKSLNKVDKFIEFYYQTCLEARFKPNKPLAQEKSYVIDNTREHFMLKNFSFEKYKLNLVKTFLSRNILYLYNVNSTMKTNVIFKNYFINSLCNIITKIYNKKVIFNIVSLKYLYLNSDILVQTLSNKLRFIPLSKKRIKLINVLKKIKLAIEKAKINEYTYNTESYEYKYIEKFSNKSLSIYPKIFSIASFKDNTNSKFYETSLNNKNFIQAYMKPENVSYLSTAKAQGSLGKLNPMLNNTINLLKFKYVFGVKLLLKGKFPNTKASARSALKSRYIGNLKYNSTINRSNSAFVTKNNNLSNVQFTKTSNLTQIGLFGIKGWINNN